MMKADLIRLVRAAQAEEDPRKREELWKMVREAGVPPDATVLREDKEVKKDLRDARSGD